MRTHGPSRAWIRPGLAVTAALTATLTACSGSGTSPSASTHHTAAASSAVTSPAAATTPSGSAPAAAGLTGLWRGQYGGAYQGTFTLHWRQSGPSLSGNIHLSNPSATVPIHGSVAGGSIRFGTVGSYAITYTGSASGRSMSGNWQIKGTGQGGNWSASKD